MSKPETALISNIHKRLDVRIYREKTANPYRRGMPDVYYEGPGTVLWVEYKWLPRQTVRAVNIARLLSPNQHQWLLRAHANQVSVCVVLGCPKRAALFFDDTWVEPQVIDWKPRLEVVSLLQQRLLPGGTDAPDNSRISCTTS